MSRTLELGQSLGRYQLTSRLAAGGMGEVWLATARGFSGFEKRVVLKTILPMRSNTKLYVDLFAQEARLSAKLNHPNLVEVFDFAEEDGIHYLAMEYLPGRSLAQALVEARKRGEALPGWFSLHVLADCCRGLDYAHENGGIIHCDLSPGNVMISFAGVTKVVDFGVAFQRGTLRTDGQLKGKLAYMAPERINGQKSDRRSDVYSLGVVLYAAFSGRLPFPQKDELELSAAVLKATPPPISQYRPVSVDIEQIISRAMAADPTVRYPSVAALGQAIDELLPRFRRPNLQLDVATHLSTLFPDDKEIPASVRARVAKRAERPAVVTPPPIPEGAARSQELSVLDIEISVDDCREEPLSAYPDSSKAYPDSSKAYPDSSKAFPDSSKAFPDSSKAYPDSSKAYPDSSKAYPDSSKAFPDSSKAFPDGSSAHADSPSASRPSNPVPPTPYPESSISDVKSGVAALFEAASSGDLAPPVQAQLSEVFESRPSGIFDRQRRSSRTTGTNIFSTQSAQSVRETAKPVWPWSEKLKRKD